MSYETILIGNDHGGVELKQCLLAHLAQRGLVADNVGSDADQIVRYPHFAEKVAGAVSRGEVRRGILICSTGIGMSIIANKFPGVRASLCTSVHMGKMTRAHNDSNLLCLGGKITDAAEALAIVDAWLDTPFEGGRHCISLDLIREAEVKLLRPANSNPSITSIPAL